MQFSRCDPCPEFSLCRPFWKYQGNPLEPASPRLGMLRWIHLIHPPDQCALLIVKHGRFTAQIARSEDKVVFNPVADLPTERRPMLAVFDWRHHQDSH